jgi:hypothetical protein
MDEITTQHAYAAAHLLPIWERWTDGNLAMRRALACDSADPLTQEERRNILFQNQCRFQGRGDSPANMAAMLAAQACQYALLSYPIEMVEQVGAEAMRWHETATSRAGSMLAGRLP